MYIMSNPNDDHMFSVTFSLIEMIINEKCKQNGSKSNKITIELINKYLPEIEKHLPGIKKHLPLIHKHYSNHSDSSKETTDQYRKISHHHNKQKMKLFPVDSYKTINQTQCNKVLFSIEHDKSCAENSVSEEESTPKYVEIEFNDVDVDIDSLKESVIEHSNSLITCYQEKLSSCEEHKKQLKKCLNKCQTKNDCLEEKIKCCHSSLNLCEDEKKRIMSKAKKCEKKILSLTEKYEYLKNEYEKKNNELARCKHQNDILIKEISELKNELDKCIQCKNKLRQKVEKLHQCLQTCKTDKTQLQQSIDELKRKLKKCRAKNKKLQCENEKLQKEINKLNETIQTLKCQNDELREENADLKCKLSKAIKTIKCLCHKYKYLKKLCFNKYC